MAGLSYPYDWGFIPSTRAEDGDPLDALIIHDAATYPGLVLTCRPVGVLEIVQAADGKKERNDRLFVVPDRSPFEGDLEDIRQLPKRAKCELEEFFLATDALEAKKLKFLGWEGPEKAKKIIKKLARWQKRVRDLNVVNGALVQGDDPPPILRLPVLSSAGIGW
jgi:inorganic pyrophosphatase